MNESHTPPQLDLKRLLWRTAAGIGALVIIVVGLALWFKEPLLAFSKVFVERLGAPGVGLGFFLPDAFAIPIPQDAVMALGLIGGLGFLEIAAWASVGSLVGGACGFWVGRNLGRIGIARRILERYGAQVTALMHRHGVTGVAIGALTPIPYCLCCWAAGGLGMRFSQFAAVSLLRIPRVVFYLWLIERGALSAMS